MPAGREAALAVAIEALGEERLGRPLGIGRVDDEVADLSAQLVDLVERDPDLVVAVAGVVGVMMAHVMGATDPDTLDRAADLGLAFQMTNIARDVMDDAAVGRVYLPERWLAEAWLIGSTGSRCTLVRAE